VLVIAKSRPGALSYPMSLKQRLLKGKESEPDLPEAKPGVYQMLLIKRESQKNQAWRHRGGGSARECRAWQKGWFGQLNSDVGTKASRVREAGREKLQKQLK